MSQEQHDDDPRAAAIKADLESLEQQASAVSRRLLLRVLVVLGFVGIILVLSWLVGRASRED